MLGAGNDMSITPVIPAKPAPAKAEAGIRAGMVRIYNDRVMLRGLESAV